MKRERTYWHMQMHPNNIKWGKENDILEKNIIGIGDWNDKKATSQIKALKSMKDGDIVLVKRGGTPLALVQVVGKFDSNKDEGYKIGGNNWIYYKRDVYILENLLATEESRDKVPQSRGALQKSIDRNSKTYKYIDNWYKEIIEDIENNKIINIEEYQEYFTISIEELKKQLNKTDNIKYIDILNFYKESVKDIKTIDIEIENLKSIKKLNKKFTIKHDKGLYTIVGNNGIGKSALLISLGHLVNHTFLQTEFKGDSFDDSKITYTFNNLVKFEWKKYNQKDKSKSWTIQNKKFDMPKIDGFFESGVISGTRFEHLNFTKEVLGKVDKNQIKEDSIQDNESIKFIKDNLNYIINGKEKNNKYDSLFTDKISIKKINGKKIQIETETMYFYKDNNKIISEYAFSTGEYFILALLKFISKKSDKDTKSLIIIDEIDISLHPLAQRRLLEKIKCFKDKYNITFIIATHSLQIIENLKAEDIYYFENDKGSILISNPIYPAYLTRKLYKHTHYDRIILVEDDVAKLFIEEFIKNYKILDSKKLSYQIISIGGWEKVIETAVENKIDKSYSNAKVLVALDEDIRHNIDILHYKEKKPKDIKINKVNVKKYIVKNILTNTRFITTVNNKINNKSITYKDIIINNKEDINKYYKEFIGNYNNSSQEEVKEIIQNYIYNDLLKTNLKKENLTYKTELIYIPIDENIERYTMTNLIENKEFHTYIEDELLGSKNFSDLNIKICNNCKTDKIKDSFKELIEEIDKNTNKKEIKKNIISFIVQQELDEYIDFKENLISFFEDKND